MAILQKIVRGTLVNDRGTWTVRGRVYDPATGKTHQKSKTTGFKVKNCTKRKAEKVMRDVVGAWEQAANAASVSYDPVFAEYIQKWIEKKSFSLKANSVKSYQDYANVHILPMLGHIKVKQMTLKDLQSYYTGKIKILSVNSLRKHHCIISGALLDAVRDGIIPANFANYVEFPKAEKFEGKAYNVKQVADLMEVAEVEGEPVHAAVILAVCYGLRRSEICGLRWSDIDFDNGQLYVRNTVVQNGTLKIEAERTKTAKSRRTIDLIASTVPYLMDLKQRQLQSGIQLDKVCVRPDGKEMRPDYITYIVRKAIDKHGLEQIRLHDLRHTAGTLLSTRATMKQVQEFLGHEDVSTTANIYVHLLDEDRKVISEIMDTILKDSVFCVKKSSEPKEPKPNGDV